MDGLNYHHLLYFHTVAKEGSITRAAAKLGLAQPTISGQIRELEESLGEKLFHKSGRGLALTGVGHTVFRYADEIFSLGKEMVEALAGHPRGRPARLVIGVSDVIPKLIAYRMVRPALEMKDSVRLVCLEGKPEKLLASLAAHEIDLVLTDAPAPPHAQGHTFSHLLGASPVSFFATAEIAVRYRKRFPASLDGAPFLLPSPGTALRRALDGWFEQQSIRPLVVGEFEDSALLKVFGQTGNGVFAGPSVIEKEIRDHYRVASIGRAGAITETFHAVSVERRLKHPAVVAILAEARGRLFQHP